MIKGILIEGFNTTNPVPEIIRNQVRDISNTFGEIVLESIQNMESVPKFMRYKRLQAALSLLTGIDISLFNQRTYDLDSTPKLEELNNRISNLVELSRLIKQYKGLFVFHNSTHLMLPRLGGSYMGNDREDRIAELFNPSQLSLILEIEDRVPILLAEELIYE